MKVAGCGSEVVGRISKSVTYLAAFAVAALAGSAGAATVTADMAESAARGWVHRGKTLGASFPSDVAVKTTTHATTNGAAFFSVKMENGGTVFMSGDTEQAPVVCFTSDTGDFSTIDSESPLWAMLNGDLSSRAHQASATLVLATTVAASRATASSTNAQNWNELIAEGEALDIPTGTFRRILSMASGVTSIGDVRVSSFVKSRWDQADVNSLACYNYYTPNGSNPSAFEPGSKDNAVCGCVATAMAQIMRYWEYPTASVAPVTRACTWNKTKTMNLTTQGGVYDWANMTLVPGDDEPELNRQAIGKLTSDAGISVGMGYTSSSSGAIASDVAPALKSTFGYASAEFFGSDSAVNIAASAYPSVLLSNLDAGCPVLLSIYGSSAGGHAIVGDGYGYNNGKTYIHLNMGWSGQKDLWYNVPDIDTDGYKFTMLYGVIYNIFPDKEGQIISGRIVDDEGDPVEGATVTAYSSGTRASVATMTTKANGIYGLILPKGSYDVEAKSANGQFANTVDGLTLSSKNLWGNDMELSAAAVRIGSVTYTRLDKALVAAQDGDVLEVLLPTELKKSFTVTNAITICATNADAAASLVTRKNNAALTVANGASLTLTNIAFEASSATLVSVKAGGCVKIRDGVDLGVDFEQGTAIATADAAGFVLAGALSKNILLKCTKATKVPETFGSYLCAPSVAEASAKMVICADDENRETRGAASAGALSWQVMSVPVEESAGWYVTKDAEVLTTNAYVRLDRVFSQYAVMAPNALPRIVIRKSGTLSCVVTVTNRMEVVGEGDVTVTLAGTASFRVPDNAELMFSNIVFTGYEDADSSDDYGFVSIDGGSFTLDQGAILDGLVGMVYRGSGIVDLNAGTMTMKAGSSIVNCRAEGGAGTGFGGAIYVLGRGCELNLQGGVISNCYASTYGGGIYAYGWGSDAGINLSGNVTIVDNWSGNYPEADDLYMNDYDAHAGLKLVGALNGQIGIRYYDTEGNAEGDVFAVFASGIGAQALEKSAYCFFNDEQTLRHGIVVGGNQLAWKAYVYDGQCPEANAVAHVYYPNGGVNHYTNFETAVSFMTNGTTARIEMYRGKKTAPNTALPRYDLIQADVVLPADCVLTLMAGESDFRLRRTASASILVPAGTSLTVGSIVLDREAGDPGSVSNALIAVAGGSLTLSSGAVISNIVGNASRDAGAIAVYAAKVGDVLTSGTLTMQAGSRIVECQNCYNSKVDFATEKNYGCGGGVLLDNSTAYFNGGEIVGCLATRGGGVYASNDSKVYVSGGMRISDNRWLNTNDVRRAGNVYVSDDTELCLTSPLTGRIGTGAAYMVGGAGGDTNVAATVSDGYDWTANVVALTNSAANFVRDVNGDIGVAATNGTKAIIVWCGAVWDTGSYDWEDETYHAILPAVRPALTPDPEEESEPEPEPSAALPEITDPSRLATELQKLTDPALAENITTLEEYNEFREWANDVVGGSDAVAGSSHAYESYEFGTTNLFTSTPAVEIAEMAMADGAMTLSVVVKDGEDVMAVASAKVAELFEGTTDLTDWTTAGKRLDLTADVVNDDTQAIAEKVSFTVSPAGNPQQAFIRLKY